MVNKKMFLSILLIACVGVATAGTWANYVTSASSNDNTLRAGMLALTFKSPANTAFEVINIIPGQENEQILKKIVYRGDTQLIDYSLKPMNTGNLAGDLYISKEAVSSVPSLEKNVHIYYATVDNVNQAIEITDTPTKTYIKLEPDDFAILYFWYSYDNVDSSTQNDEMGQTVTENLKFELRNPDTPTSPPIIY